MHTHTWNKPRFSLIQLLGILAVICVLSLMIYHIANACSVKGQTVSGRELSFKSVSVTTKDTLWSIAKENYTEEYGSIQNYIKEIKRCNSLTSDDIYAGSFLLVPVYETIIE